MSGATDDMRARFARIVLRALASTWRITDSIPAECIPIISGEQNAVIAFWHYQMLPIWFRYRELAPSAVVSMSRDGSILAGYLKSLGYHDVLRGSSTRGGSIVLNEAVEALAVRSVLVTPDGPRGPARRAKAGAIVAARRAGVPLMIAGWSCRRAIRFDSWDSMAAPVPFSAIRIRAAIYHPDASSQDERVADAELDRFSRALDEVSGLTKSG